jgi:transcriptional regulator with XRE-family HTH domain
LGGLANERQRRKFGETLRSVRDDSGLSQAAVGELVGVTGSAVGQWETGKIEPGRDTVFSLERALDLDAGRLSRDLGYLPPDPLDRPDVVAAIEADPRLSDQARVMLIALYRSAVLSSAESAASASATRRRRDRRS